MTRIHSFYISGVSIVLAVLWVLPFFAINASPVPQPLLRSPIARLTSSQKAFRQRSRFVPNDNSNDDYDNYDWEEEREQLNEIKRALTKRLGGYRPYNVNPSPSRPGTLSWTAKIVFANVVVYGLQMFSPSITRRFAKQSSLILEGKELYRLVTPVFLHGSVMHLMFNTFSLQNIGPEVEKLFGEGRFLATYIAAGIAGNIASAIKTPNPSLGASGAVFGLMGAYYACLSQNEDIFGKSGERMMGRVGGSLAINIFFGLMSPNIDNWAHVGGGIGGAAMAITFGPKLSVLGLPGGGSIVVDKPAVRLPSVIEELPITLKKKIRKGRVRMQVDKIQSNLPATPWRRNRRRQRRPPTKLNLQPKFEN